MPFVTLPVDRLSKCLKAGRLCCALFFLVTSAEFSDGVHVDPALHVSCTDKPSTHQTLPRLPDAEEGRHIRAGWVGVVHGIGCATSSWAASRAWDRPLEAF